MPLVFCFYISRPGYLFNAPFNCAQRFAAWCSAGFLPLTLIRSRNLKYTTNVDTKNVAPHCTKPMLQVGVLSVVSPNVFKSFRCPAFFYFFQRGREFFKTKLSCVGFTSSFANIGQSVGCAVCKCACNCVGLHLKSFPL